MTLSLSHHEIYDAALDDDLFQLLPLRMAGEMQVPSAMFFWIHPGDVQEVSAGTQPEANSHYEEFLRQDLWMAEVKDERMGIGAFRLTDYVSPKVFEKSAMYNDYIVENRLERYWCLGMVQGTRDGMVVSAFHKGKSAGDFSDAQLKYVNRHARDLGRLHAIRRELVRNNIRAIADADRTLADDVPIFELDHDCRLLRVNGMGEKLLMLHPLLRLQSDGVLSIGGPVLKAFRQSVGRATREKECTAGCLDLAQQRAADGRILPGLRLNFLPRYEGGRRVLVIVTTREEVGLRASFETPEDQIRLTRRECDILNGLIRGRRRDQLAHDLGVSVPTVDFHSNSLRRKMGARTLPEVIAIAFRLGLVRP
ncbi:LuxR C-terminal-related transcriptional regulator [Pseudooceanicola algae]|uniref:Uncharacterized protein n=1 Tax=Pseudooceanicola algae TaxID=1537215 RepID=A0A418SCL2_9RHOB|nr:LuxR C-terminal-related transcriptional regulator [Pseudooceanicola algae]QPM90063.1 hypothetical protein PSAL_012960 [Pseudooceanicola algae]